MNLEFTTFAVSFTALLLVCSDGQPLNGAELYNLLVAIDERSLGARELQRIFDNAEYEPVSVNGTELISKVASELTMNFAQAADSVRKIVSAARDLPQFLTDVAPTRCCQYPTDRLEFDQDFNSSIDLRSACSQLSEDASADATFPYSDEIGGAFDLNRVNNMLTRWQYIGTEQGAFVRFPAINEDASKCGKYDPRYRPWYVEAADNNPNDIVVVIDKSESTSRGGVMSAVQAATRTLLGTLNPDDRIGVVAFSTDAFTVAANIPRITSCFSKGVAFATPGNMQILQEYIDSLEAEGTTKYLKALDKAFDLFENSENIGDTRKREKIMVFFTDGRPYDDTSANNYQKIYDLVKRRNEALNNQVVILTYGLGSEIDQHAKELLSNLAWQNFTTYTGTQPKKGFFTFIDDTGDIRYQLSSYYKFFTNDNHLTDPIVSVPYIDYSGLGVVTTLALPIYHQNSTFFGVAGVDVRMADLLAKFSYLLSGEHAYVFVIDTTGRAFIHPHLPSPFDEHWETSFPNIEGLERDSAMEDIINSMKRSESGYRRIQKQFVTARGSNKFEGVQVATLSSDVYWEPIRMTKFSVCLVMAVEENRYELVPPTSYASPFVYHRLDLYPQNLCSYNKKLSTDKTATVKFSARAFTSPGRYFTNEETSDLVQRYKNYMEGDDGSGVDDYFKAGVRESVSLLSAMDAFWIRNRQRFSISYYAATVDGTIRVYPGGVINARYDPQTRSWYRRALAHKSQYTVAVPYIDALGFGLITTLSRAVYVGNSRQLHSEDDQIAGVIGIDFRVSYIGYLLNVTFPLCTNASYRCFVVDDSGYMIYDPEFEHEDGAKKADHLHIATAIPDITWRLINEGFLQYVSCVDVHAKQNYKTMRLSMDPAGIRSLHQFPHFELYPILSSNLFLGIRLINVPPSSFCTCPTDGSNFDRCLSDAVPCECPCHLQASFKQCSNVFDDISDGDPVCADGARTSDFPSPVKNEAQLVADLDDCFADSCEDLTSQGECASVLGCHWCQTEEDSFSCIQALECASQQPSDNTTGTDPPKTTLTTDNKTGLYAGVSAALALVMVVGLGILAVFLWRKFGSPSTEPTRESRVYEDLAMFNIGFKPETTQESTGDYMTPTRRTEPEKKL